MNVRQRLRQYLEQRRDLGETELVLDGLTVEEVLRILGAVGQGGDREVSARAAPAREPETTGGATEWRAALRQAETEERERRGTPAQAEKPAPPPTPPTAAAGLAVGTGARELFGGPLDQLRSLEDVAGVVAKCIRCPLYATALNPVPGTGSATAELVCVGEAPGATEDEMGQPFVGAAGQLLTKILGAIDLRREDVFICNVLKHRPPGNRNPRPEEVEACKPYLIRQLEIIRPRVILALGTFAAQTLLDTKLAIGKLRGAVHRYHGVPLVVTYHPAALLRNPSWKRPTWEDVQLVRRILDSPAGAS